jgi:hypothetical protein
MFLFMEQRRFIIVYCMFTVSSDLREVLKVVHCQVELLFYAVNYVCVQLINYIPVGIVTL